MESPLHITPFSIHIEAKILSDLRERIRDTRWPDQAPGPAWEQGTDLEYLKQLLAYWADEFDWHAQERELNAANQFRAELDGVHIHFVHERARHGHGIPLILTHGWPSTFVELLPRGHCPQQRELIASATRHSGKRNMVTRQSSPRSPRRSDTR